MEVEDVSGYKWCTSPDFDAKHNASIPQTDDQWAKKKKERWPGFGDARSTQITGDLKDALGIGNYNYSDEGRWRFLVDVGVKCITVSKRIQANDISAGNIQLAYYKGVRLGGWKPYGRRKSYLIDHLEKGLDLYDVKNSVGS